MHNLSSRCMHAWKLRRPVLYLVGCSRCSCECSVKAQSICMVALVCAAASLWRNKRVIFGSQTRWADPASSGKVGQLRTDAESVESPVATVASDDLAFGVRSKAVLANDFVSVSYRAKICSCLHLCRLTAPKSSKNPRQERKQVTQNVQYDPHPK